MSVKRYAHTIIIILIFNLSCFGDSDPTTQEDQLKYIVRLMINTLYNHNFEHPYTVDSILDPYLNPNGSFSLYKSLLAQDPVHLAQKNQMQMTETHKASTLHNISDDGSMDTQVTARWKCVTPVMLSLVKGPIEITYPVMNTIVFVYHSDNSLYIESFNSQISGQPTLFDHAKMRTKNCTQ